MDVRIGSYKKGEVTYYVIEAYLPLPDQVGKFAWFELDKEYTDFEEAKAVATRISGPSAVDNKQLITTISKN